MNETSWNTLGLAKYKDVTTQYKNTRVQGDQGNDLADINHRKEIQFKASHVLLLGFFSWILYVPPNTDP